MTLPNEPSLPPKSALTAGDIIRLNNVSRIYKLGKERIPAVSNINLGISKGEFVAITGASGSGKSTLLHLIGCIETPTSGDILINNQKTSQLNDAKLSALRNQTIGFVFQSFYLQPFLRLEDNVAVPAMFSSKNSSAIKGRVAELLDRVGLADRARHFPSELSGGQIQRAAIARALVNQPDILLADEPTGNLDSNNSQIIVDLFKQIRAAFGTTIVVVTHNPDIASQADRVITLKDGVIV